MAHHFNAAILPLFVATLLAGLAFVVRRARASDKANRRFALFVTLVGANYLLLAVARLFEGSTWAPWLVRAAFAAQLVETPVLLSFAAVYPRRNALGSSWVRGIAWSAAAALGVTFLLDAGSAAWPSQPVRLAAEAFVTLGQAVAVAGFVLVSSRGGPTRIAPAHADFLAAWCVILFARLTVAAFNGTPLKGTSPALAYLIEVGIEFGAAAILLGGSSILLGVALAGDGRALVRRVVLRALLGMAALWGASSVVPVLSLLFNEGQTWSGILYTAASVLENRYALRWVVFVLLAGPAFLRNQVFEMEPRERRALLTGLVGGCYTLVFLSGLAALSASIRVEGGFWLRATVVVAAVAVAASQSMRIGRRVADRVFPPERERDEAYRRMRRIEIYRDTQAAVRDGRANGIDLDALRVALGLTDEDARTAAALVSRPAPLQAGTRIADRYRLTAPLARGGTGKVWRAWDERDSREVALKALDAPESRGSDIDHEVSVARRVSHPQILSVLDHGYERGVAFIVTPLLAGGSLSDRLAKGPLPREEARSIALDVLDALDAAHAAGVVHRDLKPSNVMLDDKGRALVADFGIAFVSMPGRTATSLLDPRVAGTVAYLAPEALDGEQPKPAADIYAVGTLLLEMVTGRAPRPLDGAPPGLPPGLREIVARARAVDPGDRFPDARTMREALAAVQV